MASIFVIKLKNASVASNHPTLFPLPDNRHVASQCMLDILKSSNIPFAITDVIDTTSLEQRIVYPTKSFLYSTPEQKAVEEICAKIYASQKDQTFPHAIFLGRNMNLEPGAFILDRAGGRRYYQWKLTFAKEQEKSMAETFPKFLKLVSDPDNKFVISFGSGGLRLFSQPSMMKFINVINARRFVDEVWGCSGGAISGLLYAMAVEPEAIEQRGYDIYNKRFQFKISPSALIVAKNTFLGMLNLSPPDMLNGFISAQESLQSAISTLIANKKLDIPFYCVAYNVKHKRNETLTPQPVEKAYYKDLITSANPIDAVVASSSIPIVYVPKKIKKGKTINTYVDGAIAEPVPLLSIYRKWLIDREHGIEKRPNLIIFAIDPLSSKTKQSWLVNNLLGRLPFADVARLGVGVFGLVMRARIHNQIELLSEDRNVKVLMVSLPLKTSTTLDIKMIPRIIHDAQTVLLEQLYRIEESL